MSFSIGSVTATITANIDGFKKGISEAKDQLSGFKKSTENMTDSLNNLRNKGNLALAAVAATTGYIGKLGVDAAAQNEKNLAAFTTLFQDESKAFEYLAKVKKDAANTPFNLQGLVDINQILLGTGITAEKVSDLVSGMGDVVSGVGKGSPELTRMGNTISQVFGKGKADAVDFRELVNAGWTTVRTDVTETMGITMSQFEDMVTNGDIGYTQIEDTIKRVTGEGGRFWNAQERQSQTFSGQMERLFDTVNLGLGDIIVESGIFDMLKDGLDQLSTFLEKNKDSIVGFFKDLGKQLKDFLPKIVEFGKWLGDNKEVIIAALTGIATALGAFFIISQIIALIGLLSNPLGWIIIAAGLLAAAWQSNFIGIQDIVYGFVPFVKEKFEQIKGFFQDLWIKIKDIVGVISQKFQEFKDFWIAVFTPIGEFFGWWWYNLIEPILLLIEAVFLRVFYEISTRVTSRMSEMLEFLKSYVFEPLKIAFQVLGDFLGKVAKIAWEYIKSTMVGRFLESSDEIIDIAKKIYDFVSSNWDNLVNFFIGIKDKIVNAITEPFEQAKRKIEEIGKRIRDAANEINPFTRHSPSLVDNVKKGLGIIKDEYLALGDMKLSLPIEDRGTSLAGLASGIGGTSSAGGISIDLRGSTISSQADAEMLAETIGDTIIKRLSKNVRF